jgi:hypothetical protein
MQQQYHQEQRQQHRRAIPIISAGDGAFGSSQHDDDDDDKITSPINEVRIRNRLLIFSYRLLGGNGGGGGGGQRSHIPTSSAIAIVLFLRESKEVEAVDTVEVS